MGLSPSIPWLRRGFLHEPAGAAVLDQSIWTQTLFDNIHILSAVIHDEPLVVCNSRCRLPLRRASVMLAQWPYSTIKYDAAILVCYTHLSSLKWFCWCILFGREKLPINRSDYRLWPAHSTCFPAPINQHGLIRGCVFISQHGLFEVLHF